MIDAGILDEDERVQLLGGLIVVMTPQQLPLTLGEDDEPEPDLAVVRAAGATRSPAAVP